MRVMIVVTHLLGTGHLARALTLGRAFAGAGHDVAVVSGGTPVPHFDQSGLTLVQLPPLRSDGTDFTTLLDADGTVATAAYRAGRTDALLQAFAAHHPDVLITELFPFGRRNLRDEFQALLATAKGSGALVLSSIRDILAPPSKPSKIAFAEDMVQRVYHAILVHADPAIVSLDHSWPVSETLAQRLHYTGFVAPPAPAAHQGIGDAIVVSAGGGAVGNAIFDAALAAAARRPDMPWHILIGGDAQRRDTYTAKATDNVAVEAPRSDFRDLLGRAAASVSMCGYNTALDLLQTGTPAVLVPFDDGTEVEQGLRAKALARQSGIASIRTTDLTPEALLTALDRVIGTHRAPRRNGMDGAERSVRIVENLLEAHHGSV